MFSNFSKRFQLSIKDIKSILTYFAYGLLAVLLFFPDDVERILTGQWVGQWIISLLFTTWVAFLKKFLQDNSMEDPLNIMDWSKEWDYDEDDILLEWENAMLDKLSKVANADDVRISYDQYADANTKSACTLFSPLWVISSIFNTRLSFAEIMDARWYAVKNFWYKKWQGAYFETWVRCIVKRWNLKFPDNQVMYFKATLGSPEVDKVLEKWYGICGWYKGNAKYNTDRMDGKLDGTDFGETTYGHATSVHLIKWLRRCYDSMPKMMKYIFANHPAKIKWWYKNCYVILPVKELPKAMSKKLQEIRAKRWLAIHNTK